MQYVFRCVSISSLHVLINYTLPGSSLYPPWLLTIPSLAPHYTLPAPQISLLKDFSNLKTFPKPLQTNPKLTKLMQTITNLSRPIQTFPKPFQIFLNLSIPFQTFQTFLNLSKTHQVLSKYIST